MEAVRSEGLSEFFSRLLPLLGERESRLVGASVAHMLGHGGISTVARAAGVGRGTITRGLGELARGREEAPLAQGRQRRPGGGRKRLTEQDPTLLRDLDALVEPTTRGDPQSGLRWTCKSLRKLAGELGRLGHQVSARKVGELLHALGYRPASQPQDRRGQ